MVKTRVQMLYLWRLLSWPPSGYQVFPVMAKDLWLTDLFFSCKTNSMHLAKPLAGVTGAMSKCGRIFLSVMPPGSLKFWNCGPGLLAPCFLNWNNQATIAVGQGTEGRVRKGLRAIIYIIRYHNMKWNVSINILYLRLENHWSILTTRRAPLHPHLFVVSYNLWALTAVLWVPCFPIPSLARLQG